MFLLRLLVTVVGSNNDHVCHIYNCWDVVGADGGPGEFGQADKEGDGLVVEES